MGDAVDPAAEGWAILQDEGFLGWVGPIWTREKDGELHLAVLAMDKHRNRRGVMQGGMIATLLDRGIGRSVFVANGGRSQATVQLDLHFLRPVRIGNFVEVRSRIERRTRSITFASGTATVEGIPVATARGVWKMLGPDR